MSATKLNYAWVARGSDRTLGIGAPIHHRRRSGHRRPQSARSSAPASSTGRIVDEFNEPVAGVQRVGRCAFRTRRASAALLPAALTMTNDIGEFRLFGLQPGAWYLAASANGIQWLDYEATDSVYLEHLLSRQRRHPRRGAKIDDRTGSSTERPRHDAPAGARRPHQWCRARFARFAHYKRGRHRDTAFWPTAQPGPNTGRFRRLVRHRGRSTR